METRKHFSSVSDWLDFTSKLESDNPGGNSNTWMGKLTREEILYRARYGDLSLMDQVNSLTEKLHLPDTEGKEWEPSVTGPVFCIPEVIAGHPLNARRLELSESERAPIRIFVNPFLSAGVTLEQGLKRGITIAALVTRLQMTHPVELILVTGECRSGHPCECLITISVGLLPIDMSVLAFLLARPEVYRRLIIPVRYTMNNYGPSGSAPANTSEIKELLEIGEHDLYLGSLVLGDKLMNDPIAWINEQVERFNKGDE